MIHQITLIIFICACWNMLSAIFSLASGSCYDLVDTFYSGVYNVLLALVTGSHL